MELLSYTIILNTTTSDSINTSIAQSHGNKIINGKLGNPVVSQVEPYNYNYNYTYVSGMKHLKLLE